MTADSTIDYESLQQEALRGVVKAVLTRVARSGLPGDHHLYISFDVKAPGVVLSKRLREKYPNEMTIVLQYRFWDLAITDERFEVKLTFDGIPERLVVPFTAIKVFIDPSVRYVLHFEDPLALADDTTLPSDGETGPGRSGIARNGQLKRPRPPRPRPARTDMEGATAGLAAVPSPVPSQLTKPQSIQGNGTSKPSVKPSAPEAPSPPGEAAQPGAQSEAAPAAATSAPASAPPSSGAQVVSLDAFRKK